MKTNRRNTIIAALALSLPPALSAPAQILPAPADFPAGPASMVAPDAGHLPQLTDQPSPEAPVLSAISETTYPGETLVITGANLDGAHLRAWAEGVTFDIMALRTAHDRMQAVIPTEVGTGEGAVVSVPRATMLVWPVREGRAGSPMRVNAATAWWAWPCRVRAGQAGQTLRIFGKNLTTPNRPPLVFLQGEAGPARALEGAQAHSYSIEARLPEDLTPGRYRLWIHNGSGGAWGWSEAVGFEVVQPPTATYRVYVVDDYLAKTKDASKAIIEAAQDAKRLGGGVIQFSARRYVLKEPLLLPEDVAVTLRGVGAGEWDSIRNEVVGQATVLETEFTTPGTAALELRSAGSSVQDLTLIFAGPKHSAGIRLAGPDQSVRNATVVCVSPVMVSACIESRYRGRANHEIVDCALYMFHHCVRVTEGTDFVRIADCKLRGHFSIGRGTLADAVVNWGGNEMIMEGCDVQSEDRVHGKIMGRTCLLYRSSIRNCYLAHNRSTWVGPHSSVAGIEGNTGEQFLFHRTFDEPGVYEVRTAEADRITVDASNLPPRLDGSGDWIVFIARGPGVGQWRTIVGRADAATVQLDRPFRVNPQPGSIAIIHQAFRHNIVYDNFIDPAPDPAIIEPDMRTMGIFFFHNSVDNIAANNVIQHVAVGISIATNPDTPSAWNLVRDNQFRQMTGLAGDGAHSPAFYCEYSLGVFPPYRKNILHWVSVGNVFRGNAGAEAPTAVQVGWLRGAEQWDQDFAAGAEAGLVMSVIENNEFSQVDQPLRLTAPANWTLWRDNSVGNDAASGEAPRAAGVNVIEPLLLPEQVPVTRGGVGAGE
jgi:hypothetical protein